MRRKIRAGATAAVALALLLPAAAVTGGAQASEADPTWVRQEAFGAVRQNFNVRQVLFDGNRFPTTNQQTQRPNLKKYLAFGTMDPFTDPVRDTLVAQVGMSTSDEGRVWTDPVGLTVTDAETGVDVPLIVNEPNGLFSVVYGDLPQFSGEGPETFQLQFAIYYRDAGSLATAGDFDDFHFALSADAQSFTLDDNFALTQDADDPVIPAGASSRGPTQVLFDRSGDDECAPGTPSFPYGCRAVMVHEINDVTGTGLLAGSSIGVAGSPDGLTFFGAGVILAPGEEAWDDVHAGWGQLEEQPDGSFALYYAGATGSDPPACFGGLSACYEIGVATSPTGLPGSFTKASQNPVVPRSLLEFFSPNDPSSVQAPSPVFAEDRLFFTRITNGAPDADPIIPAARDLFLAMRVDAPGEGPQIIIDNPVGGVQPQGEVDLRVSLVDTLGTNPGIDDSSITVTLELDGTGVAEPLTGWTVEPALYRSLKVPARFLLGEGLLAGLPDGTHLLTISVADLESNVTTETVEILIDTIPPDTEILTAPDGPALTIPTGSLGSFTGTSVDADSALLGIRATVTNPIGMTKIYESRIEQGQLTRPPQGFSILALEDEGKSLTWRWVDPSPDTHKLLPGPYTVTFQAFDIHTNVESPDTDNTGGMALLIG